jgi:hypothetical protein
MQKLFLACCSVIAPEDSKIDKEAVREALLNKLAFLNEQEGGVVFCLNGVSEYRADLWLKSFAVSPPKEGQTPNVVMDFTITPEPKK